MAHDFRLKYMRQWDITHIGQNTMIASIQTLL